MNAILLVLALAGGVDECLHPRQLRVDISICKGDPLGSKSEGTIKVLAEPSLSCFNRQSLSFMIGSESRDKAMPFSIRFEASPILQSNGTIRLVVSSTIYEPCEGLGIRVGNKFVPGFTERTARHTQTVKPGEVFRLRIAAESPEMQTWAELKVTEEPRGK